jgi:protein lysine acetyltransferase
MCGGRVIRSAWGLVSSPPTDARRDREAIVADLSGFDLLSDAEPADLERLADLVTRFVAPAGTVLMRPGDVARHFLLLTSGHAEVVVRPGGMEKVAVIGPGSIVGEIALLRREHRMARVTAVSELRGLQGDRAAFTELMGIPGVVDRVVVRARQRLAADLLPVAVALPDGTRLRLRPVFPDDMNRLLQASALASEQTRYRRFFSAGDISPATARYLTEVDYVDHFVWVAMDDDDVAVAGVSYVRSQADPEVADISFSVFDEYQGRGVGTLLMGAIAVAAHHCGISHFTADVLAENRPMLAILDRAHMAWESEGQVLHGVSEVPDPGAFGIERETAAALGALVDEILARTRQSLSVGAPLDGSGPDGTTTGGR